MQSQFAAKIQEMQKLQAELNQMVSDLNQDLLELIASENCKQIPELKSDGPIIALVPYQTIQASPGHILAADYYLPSCQVEAVRYQLNKCVHAEQVCKVIKTMLTEKRVKTSGGYTLLNETTLRILRESDLGRFVKSEEIY